MPDDIPHRNIATEIERDDLLNSIEKALDRAQSLDQLAKSRPLSLVITKLQEAEDWAKRIPVR